MGTPYKLAIGAVAAVAAVWAAATWLKPLGQLIPNTKAMVTATKEILAETERLHVEVGKVQSNLGKVKEQQRLLAEQKKLMAEAVVELERQEQLAGGSKALLVKMLEAERATAAQTAAAANAGAASMATVEANVSQLNQLGAATLRIQRGSDRIDRQMDGLLAQMQDAAVNFAAVEKYKKALNEAAKRPASAWDRLKEWFSWGGR